MTDANNLDMRRSNSDYWNTVFRRLGNNMADPAWVESVVTKMTIEGDELASVNLGDAPVFLLIERGKHRTWVIGHTYRLSSGALRTNAHHEWYTPRELTEDSKPRIVRPSVILMRPKDLKGAVRHRVSPHDVRKLLLSEYPSMARRADLDDLDPVALLRICIHLERNATSDSDDLAQQRAVRYALTMRDLVRRCFSRHPDLWDGASVRDMDI